MTSRRVIRVKGARQHNLKGINFTIPLNRLTVVTGVSGSGKSSLAFDTLYAEGQRRYIESFSTYARQFLDRMDKPEAESIQGIPAAIAIDQKEPVKTSRSTVGTMTEVNDFLKLLFARFGVLHCSGCGDPVKRDTPQSLWERIEGLAEGTRLEITFPAGREGQPLSGTDLAGLERLGFHRAWTREGGIPLRDLLGREDREGRFEILADRLALRRRERSRVIDSLEQAIHFGLGRGTLHVGETDEIPFSSLRRCARCDLTYRKPVPSLFSFNHPLGACDQCKGFGRTIEIDIDRVIPDPSRTLAGHAIKPWSTQSYRREYRALLRFCRRQGIPIDRPFSALPEGARRQIISGTKDFSGVLGFFRWLGRRVYRMHIRVLLSRYRGYRRCEACRGRRLQKEGLLYRIGGQTIADLWGKSITACRRFFEEWDMGPGAAEAEQQLLSGIRARLRYLEDVGLGYLTLDRSTRTLSGGEVQRVSLTTALGSSLVNTLYVLDEPSIGLHPRDNDRLLRILRSLRDRRNTVVVVEHDPAVIRAADRILDLGPGAGEAGGKIVYSGGYAGLLNCRKSLTGQYLSGARTIPVPAVRRTPVPGREVILRGVECNNLKGIDVRIPLGLFVCVTGVSGSGKSTLVEEVLHKVLTGKGRESVGDGRWCRAVEGRENAGEVVLVNQAPIGRTPKSNPATYSKAFTGIRRHFASLPAARRAGYRPGYFSFNVPGGRCGTCEGSGHEKVEMQFLADVYVRCQDCDGRRFGPEVLQVLDRGRSIADVLRMTVEEAIRFFGISSPISRTLGPLRAVGLGYLRLGQPMNTMAGGEAQRLKLARRLDPEKKGDCLFLLDEPTTGLHFEDIRRLLAAIDSLLKAGHSVVVIEHNLDVIKMADHVIDLGPEGGEAGGRIVAVGPPEAIAANLDSHTGRFLRTVLRPAGRISPPAEVPRRPGGEENGEVIRIRGAREHNLKNLEVRIPRERFIVLTGLSGSGKSTLAFDILYSEGQRRYLESLTAYARQFLKPLHRPDIDGLDGVPPVIAIEQRTSRGGKKSTVATLTEIYPYLRLLFAKLGTQHCPACALPIGAWTSRRIVGDIERVFYGKAVRIFAPVVMGRKGFHREIFARIQKERFPRVRVDGRVVRSDPAPSLDRYREHDIEILIDTVLVTKVHGSRLRESLKSGLRLGNRAVLVGPVGEAERLYSLTRMCPRCGIGFPELDPRLFSFHHRQGICSGCRGSGVDENADLRACPECRGARLRPEALAVRFRGRGIADIAALPVEGAKRFFQAIEFTPRESMVGGEIVQEIKNRLDFLEEVGLAYLGLDRPAPTLSGGEAQRLRLAAQLGSNLRGVCYILDEPTIGLHPSDNDKLLKTLRRLKKRGNTILVVEHDEATIRAADHIIDLGPGGGLEGGEIVAQGELSAILNNPASITGVWLREGAGRNDLRASRVGRGHKMLRILGARHNNLRGIDVGIPLRALTCVTGVSGSGKSSLVQEILYRALQKKLTGEGAVPGRHRRLLGWRDLDRVVEVDQSPIGRTSRSVPASYIGFLGPIRALFALVPEARARGFTPSRFSFNVPGGRCEACAGQGKTRIVMNFLPDCFVDCDACGGSRFHDDTLEILYRGKTIAGILGMTVREASSFFSVVPRVRNLVAMLEEIGLGYLRLGQPSNTLSGGEAQRIKLVAELGQSRDGRTLYILDEPTTGLHPADIDKLLGILHRLIDRGDTVIVIEHNLEVIRHADFVVDLGPGAGEEGGRLLAAAPPAALLKVKNSRTAQYLRRHLDRFRPSVKLATG